MEIGDSFAVDATDASKYKLMRYCSTYGKNLQRKFMQRTVTEDNKKVLRIWRIE